MDVILAVLLKNNSIINIALLNNYNITTFISSFRSLILSKTGPTAFSLLNLDSPFVTVLLLADSALVSALLVTTLRSGSCPTWLLSLTSTLESSSFSLWLSVSFAFWICCSNWDRTLFALSKLYDRFLSCNWTSWSKPLIVCLILSDFQHS